MQKADLLNPFYTHTSKITNKSITRLVCEVITINVTNLNNALEGIQYVLIIQTYRTSFP